MYGKIYRYVRYQRARETNIGELKAISIMCNIYKNHIYSINVHTKEILIFNSTIHNYADFSYDSLIHFDDGLFIERRKKTQILILTPPTPGNKK